MRNKTYKWLTILGILLAIITSASYIFPSSKKINITTKSVEEGAVLTSFSTTPIEKSTKGVKNSYSLKENRFSGSYYLKNDSSKTRKFSVIGLLGYKQVPISFNEKFSETHHFSIKEQKQIKRRFEIKDIQPGKHDFTIIAFCDLNNKSTKKDYRYFTDLLFHFPWRVNLVFKKEKFQTPRLTTYPQINNKTKYDFVKLSKSSKLRDQEWIVEKTSKDQNLNFYIQVANNSAKERIFAILLFLDSKQIPVGKKSKTVYVKISAKSAISIPIKIKTPDKKGAYNIFALRAFYPITKQESKDAWDGSIISSLRTALRVY